MMSIMLCGYELDNHEMYGFPGNFRQPVQLILETICRRGPILLPVMTPPIRMHIITKPDHMRSSFPMISHAAAKRTSFPSESNACTCAIWVTSH